MQYAAAPAGLVLYTVPAAALLRSPLQALTKPKPRNQYRVLTFNSLGASSLIHSVNVAAWTTCDGQRHGVGALKQFTLDASQQRRPVKIGCVAENSPCGEQAGRQAGTAGEQAGHKEVRTGPFVVLVVIAALPCSRTVILLSPALYDACSADSMVEVRLTDGTLRFIARLNVKEPPGGSAKPVGV